MHGFPRFCGCLILSFVDEHRCADALSDSDPAFGTDNVNTVGVIVGLWLRKELHIGVDAVLKTKGSVSTFAKHKSSIAIMWVNLLGMFDVING